MGICSVNNKYKIKNKNKIRTPIIRLFIIITRGLGEVFHLFITIDYTNMPIALDPIGGGNGN
jgi:hypothetical protein